MLEASATTRRKRHQRGTKPYCSASEEVKSFSIMPIGYGLLALPYCLGSAAIYLLL
jgi:hypothetical protein